VRRDRRRPPAHGERCGLCDRQLKHADLTAGRCTYSHWSDLYFCPQAEVERCMALHRRQERAEKARRDERQLELVQ
jgi:hypothetical protein